MDKPKYHNRKSVRLKEYDYTNPSWYYVTICTNDKACCLGKIRNGKMILNSFGKIIEEEWLKTKHIRKNIDLDYYVVMPNHFHGIIIIESRDIPHSGMSLQRKTENSAKYKLVLLEQSFAHSNLRLQKGLMKSGINLARYGKKIITNI